MNLDTETLVLEIRSVFLVAFYQHNGISGVDGLLLGGIILSTEDIHLE